MKNNCIKLFSTLALGVLLMCNHAFGQISNDPTDHKITLNNTLYEHGYNKDYMATPDSPREDVDTVMISSEMDYFVMPDAYYNKTYFLESDYKNTGETSSKFEWTVTNGTAAAQSANATGTSPWVKITWGTVGATTAKMKEIPQGLATVCDGAVTTIPVFVIDKPTIGFNALTASDCYDDSNIGSASYNFPITVNTGSSQVLIDYTVYRTDLLTGIKAAYASKNNVEVTNGTGILNIVFDDYGEYEVDITKITDRIARKCAEEGIFNSGVFTYTALPQPKAGKVFHIPNNF